MILAHATPEQDRAYVEWLTELARRATGRMREWLVARLSNLDEWSFLP